MLASLADEQFYQFVSAASEQKGLVVGADAVHALLAQFLECVYLGLTREF
jgi:hypothetical protein